MIKDYTLTVTNQIQVADTIYELTLAGDITKDPIAAGQFVNVKIPNPAYILRRPFGIAEVNVDQGYIKLIYRVVGDGTQILAQLTKGATLNVLGPLGHGFPSEFLNQAADVLIIGGGTGLPPLYELSRRLSAQGHHLDIALGFPNKQRVFYETKMAQFGHTVVSTDDGSYGLQGTIIDLIDQNFADKSYQAIYACGPRGLELAVSDHFSGHPHAYISAEARMACGIGICNACVLHTTADTSGATNKKVCTDGPVFHINEVVL
ncbi:MAG: dihydroorotate dehydrogenase electron transfer subunit [Lactobacillus sp.]|jgi:dihydroorotate dehydrogenase electron transfer subunit|nr:dihydroorotate dehydrogenase electron transfer subunit [Lactobacillus sp.]